MKVESPGAWLPYGGVHYAACSLPASVAVITCYLFYKQIISRHTNNKMSVWAGQVSQSP